jgi:hypothetical protein
MSREKVHGAAGMRPAANAFGTPTGKRWMLVEIVTEAEA